MAEPVHAYRETLRVPTVWWLLGLGLAATVWWVCFVVTPASVAAVAGLVTAGLASWALLRLGSVRIETGHDGLRAGRATLPWRYVGPSLPLDREETRRQLGADADARAYLVLRGYCAESVKVYVDDEADPTPYWLLSTRHPRALAEHLNGRVVQD
jgi:hypothetical protein